MRPFNANKAIMIPVSTFMRNFEDAEIENIIARMKDDVTTDQVVQDVKSYFINFWFLILFLNTINRCRTVKAFFTIITVAKITTRVFINKRSVVFFVFIKYLY